MSARIYLCLVMVALGVPAVSAGPFEVPIDEQVSQVDAELCVAGNCDSDSSAVDGWVEIELNDPAAPTELTLHDFDLWALSPINLNVTVYLFGIPVGSVSVDAFDLQMTYAQPGIPMSPVAISGDAFTVLGVPTALAGTIDYEATGTLCSLFPSGVPCVDTIVLADQGTVVGDMSGTISVSGGVATLSANPNFMIDLIPEQPGLATLEVTGHATGSAVVPIEGTGDFDGDGDVDIYDFAAFQVCFTGDLPGSPLGGCKPGDLDGDDDVDVSDYAEWFAILVGT